MKLYAKVLLAGLLIATLAPAQELATTLPKAQVPSQLSWDTDQRPGVGNVLNAGAAIIRDATKSGTADRKPAQIYRPLRVTGFLRGLVYVDTRIPIRLAPYSIGLYDVRGSKVAALQPGRNDVRHLASGTYFVRVAGEDRTAKVVIQK